jgi:hypothetical protein
MGYQKYSNAYNNTTNGKNIRYRGGGGDNTTGGAYYSPSYIKSPYDLDIDRRRGLGGGNSSGGGGNSSGGGFTGGGLKEDLARKYIRQIEKKQDELRAEYQSSTDLLPHIGYKANILKKMQSNENKIIDLQNQLRLSKAQPQLDQYEKMFVNLPQNLRMEEDMMPRPVINQNSVVGLTDYASQSTPTLLRDKPESLGQVLDDQGIPINRPRAEQLQEYKGRIASQELANNINESELLNQERINVSPETPAQAYPYDYLQYLQRLSEERLQPAIDDLGSVNSDMFDAPLSRPVDITDSYGDQLQDDSSSSSSSSSSNSSRSSSSSSSSSNSSSRFNNSSSYPQELQQGDINALTDVVETGFDRLAQRIVDLNNTNKNFTTANETALINGLTNAARQIIRDPKTLLMPIDKQLLFGIQGLPTSIKNDPKTLQALQDVIKMTSGYRGEVKPLFKTINRVKLQADPELIKARVNPAYYGDKYIAQRAPTRLSQPSDYMNMLRVYNYRHA